MGHVLPERRMQSMQPRGKAIILTRPVRYPPGTDLAKKRRATAVYVIIRDGTTIQHLKESIRDVVYD